MSPPPAAPRGPQPTARLLVVDDDPLQLRAICDALTQEGFRTTCCGGAEQALAELQAQAHDILISDLRMPDTDGIALIEQARRLDPQLVVLVMTGQGSIPTAVQAMQGGAVDYLLKPLRLVEMRPVLQRAIELRQLRRDKQELQQHIQERNAQLEATNRELEEFAARIAHDLREPVNVVRGFARLLQERREPALDTQASSYLDYILQASDRADRLVRDLLDFARLGNRPLARTTVDLNQLVAQARRMVELSNPPPNVDWQVSPLPKVAGDPSLLQQVFANLFSNAVKYSAPKPQPSVKVAYRPDAQAGHVIEIRDNGVGFNPAQAGRLFTPFQRLHRAEQFEGNGMGLANVKRIIERHGGTVRAGAVPGEGAVFTLTLPEDGGTPADSV